MPCGVYIAARKTKWRSCRCARFTFTILDFSHPIRGVIRVVCTGITARLGRTRKLIALQRSCHARHAQHQQAQVCGQARDAPGLEGQKAVGASRGVSQGASPWFQRAPISLDRNMRSCNARAGRRRHAAVSCQRAGSRRRGTGAPQPTRQLLCAWLQEKVPASFAGWEARVTGTDRVHDDGLHLHVRFDVSSPAGLLSAHQSRAVLCLSSQINSFCKAQPSAMLRLASARSCRAMRRSITSL